MAYTATMPIISTPDEVLAGVAGARDQMRFLEQGMVVFAVEWVKLNPGATLDAPYAAKVSIAANEEQELWEELAKQGCLHVDDVSIPAFADAAGTSEYAARKLVRESLMLVCLLPRVWARVLTGGIEVWRARVLAADCWELSPEAVAFVDRHMSQTTARFTFNGRQAIIAEAKRRLMPEVVADEEAQALENRRVAIGTPLLDDGGVAPLWGGLDVMDALDLDAALTTGAQALKELGSDASVDVRRAWALGDLARMALGQGELALDDSKEPQEHTNSTRGDTSDCGCTCDGHYGEPLGMNWVPPGAAPPRHVSEYPNVLPSRPHWNGKGLRSPQVRMYIHLNHTALANADPQSPRSSEGNVSGDPPEVARVESPSLSRVLLVDPQRIKAWLTRPTIVAGAVPRVLVRPVLNLDEEIYVGAYEVPDRIVEHRRLTTGSCVFPHCARPAWACDIDHTVPWEVARQGGATCSCNLAPLCRRHHRLKTHGDNTPGNDHTKWTVTPLGAGEYRWKGPGEITLIRTNRGTWDASLGQVSGGPALRSTTPDSSGTNSLDEARELIKKLVSASMRYVDEANWVVGKDNGQSAHVDKRDDGVEAESTPKLAHVADSGTSGTEAPSADQQRAADDPHLTFVPYAKWNSLDELLPQWVTWHALHRPVGQRSIHIDYALHEPIVRPDAGSQAA